MEFVVAIILLVFAVLCIVMAIKTSNIKKKQKKAIKVLKAHGLTQQLIAKHTYGLPIAEGLACTIQAYNDHIDFLSGTTHITLKNETEIQKQYVSSVGGAVGGAVLFGPLGAMIGGRAKKKTSKTTSFYFIITYKKADAALDYLGFDVSGCVWQASKLVDEFHKNNKKGNTHIEL